MGGDDGASVGSPFWGASVEISVGEGVKGAGSPSRALIKRNLGQERGSYTSILRPGNIIDRFSIDLQVASKVRHTEPSSLCDLHGCNLSDKCKLHIHVSFA